jgi:hypothetical protein
MGKKEESVEGYAYRTYGVELKNKYALRSNL